MLFRSEPAAGYLEPTIVLAAKAPMRATFRDDRVVLVGNVESIVRGNEAHEGHWQMRGVYEVASVGNGLTLRRAEPVTVVTSENNDAFTVTDAERFFPETLEFSEYTGPGQMLKNASMVISGASFKDGWMRIDLQTAASSKATPAATLVNAK